jgi:iron complex transport system ATP-binding protein
MDIAFPLTVREIVMMGRYPHFVQQPTKNDEAICNEAMLFFDISPMADRNYLTLSGGEKQRVQFARVAAQVWSTTPECKYLLLDEPLTFLDVFYQFDFMKKVKKIIHDRTIVVVGVVHDLNLASKFADQITLLHSGNVIASGTKEEVLTKDNIKLAYQLEPIIHHTNQSLNLFFE